MAQDLTELQPWLQTHLGTLSPGRRAAIARKVGIALRRANAKRIAANIQPDGTTMEPRKRRAPLRERSRKSVKAGKMFPKLRLARSLEIKATPNGVEVGYRRPMVAHTARAHQFGLVDHVGRTADGKEVRARYPIRVLLGFGPEDQAMIMDIILDMLGI